MSVFFHVNEWTKEHGHFQYLVVCLAEGLRELGFSTYGSADYWQFESGKYLIEKGDPPDADIIVYNDEGPLPAKPKRGGEKTVLMDMSDAQGAGLAGIWPDFDYVFRCQYTAGWPYPDNAIPWAFGLDSRIIQATQDFVPIEEKLYQMELNYRVQHPLRLWLEEQNFFEWTNDNIMPVHKKKAEIGTDRPEGERDGLLWDQTGRHDPNYYQRLKGSLACACFAGRLQDHTLVQFDSWRLWESLVAACVPFHFNLERYGPRLPVMPKNEEHYIGIDLEDLQSRMRRITRPMLEEIAEAGREWVLECYSPKAVATRFLREIKF